MSSEAADRDRLMTVREVADFLCLKPKGIYALVERREIAFVRVSNRLRFVRADVLSWVEERRVPASRLR